MIRVYLDDVRPAPDGWVLVMTAGEAIALLAGGDVAEISLDHDLGDDVVNGTGYTVVCWIEEAVALRGFVPPKMHIHSANVVGRERMARGIEVIERLVREPVAAYADGYTTRALPRSIGSFSSGRSDLSERVDECLAEGFGQPDWDQELKPEPPR